MFGTTFYHAMTRKYITVFGTLFNNIHIERVLDDGSVERAKVPLTYSSQDKMLARINGDPELNRKAAAFSPAISFVAGPPRYDASRKLASTLQKCIVSPTGTKTQFIGVPYNIDFTLYIYAKEEEDGLMVLEQILPYFTPSLTVTAALVENTNYEVDVPIILDDIQFDDQSYGAFQTRRTLIWTLRFTMKAEFDGPVTGTDRKIIRIVHADIRDQTFRAIMEEVRVQPGLTANGEPTSAVANSVPVTQIKADDNYGYIVEILEGPTPTP